MYRAVCRACRRPQVVCYCRLLPRIPTRTRVVFLQHPRERRMPVGTARMAHLALPNSELHEGVVFDRALAERPGAVLLFPGQHARDASELTQAPPTLVVIDGTWSQARKVLKENPALQGLPRVAFRPSRPGNYRIRREPAPECVSTVEAVSEVLSRWEGPRERFDPLLGAFDQMVDWQIERRATNAGPPRRKAKKGPPVPWVPAELIAHPEHAVFLHAEGNAFPAREHTGIEPELVQLTAARVGKVLDVLVAPRAPLASGTPRHLRLSEADLLGGASVGEAARQWAGFLAQGAVVVGWGAFSRGLLARAGLEIPGFVDLRDLTARMMRRKPGDLEAVPAKLGVQARPAVARGRAGLRLAALVAVFGALRDAAAGGERRQQE